MEIVLVTNAPEGDARESLEALGLDGAFDPMVFAEEAGAEKPDPAPYREALDRLSVSPEESLAFESLPEGGEVRGRGGRARGGAGLHARAQRDRGIGDRARRRGLLRPGGVRQAGPVG